MRAKEEVEWNGEKGAKGFRIVPAETAVGEVSLELDQSSLKIKRVPTKALKDSTHFLKALNWLKVNRLSLEN